MTKKSCLFLHNKVDARLICTDGHESYLAFFASASIFSINIPYPFAGSLTRTWVTAPTSFPFCITGEPLKSVVNRGQRNYSFVYAENSSLISLHTPSLFTAHTR